ncbi:MAG: hypothetical protein DWQ01_08610 [Planctomycetota bacterium]|nr:MAG: hypothetical protein DWQ01_08610 [Planctomycetota bacterium]
MKLDVTPSVRALQRELRREGGQVRPAMVRALNRAGLQVINWAVREAPAAWGGLRKVGSYKVEVDEQKLLARIGPVSKLVRYALPIEKGTKPHWPPFHKIALWAKRKGINDEESIRRIYRSIGLRGTKANPFLSRAFANSKADVNRAFQNAMRESIKKAREARKS